MPTITLEIPLITAEEEMIDQISLRRPRFLVYFWSGTNKELQLDICGAVKGAAGPFECV